MCKASNACHFQSWSKSLDGQFVALLSTDDTEFLFNVGQFVHSAWKQEGIKLFNL